MTKSHGKFEWLVNSLTFFVKIEISHLNMAGDAEQTDSSGKYTFGGGAAAAKKYWPTILKSIEVVSFQRIGVWKWFTLGFSVKCLAYNSR